LLEKGRVQLAQERRVKVRVKASEASRRELQQALMWWAESVRAQRGASQASVYEDTVAPGVFCLDAAWISLKELEMHLESPACGALLGALTVLGHDVDITVWQHAPEFGGDVVESIRRRRSARLDPDEGSGAATKGEQP
jgi:quinol monooxygenase YgiN